ncbi:MAG: formylglycine-generating enzyme family protein [Verrucomicrobia bacterium]|nr:formylglycine-generating enzyme family protein [Verrucomicrobiota bacterium]
MKIIPGLSHARLAVAVLFAAGCGVAHAQPPIAPGELVAPEVGVVGGNVTLTVRPSVAGRSYKLEYSGTLEDDTWQDPGVVRVGDGNDLAITTPYEPLMPRRIYRLVLDGPPAAAPTPAGFEQIPAGSFSMGDSLDGEYVPVHSVYVSAFFMEKYEVSKALWDSVRTWGLTHGYTDLPAGSGKATNHPVQSITWYAMVKWCNARSEKDGLTPCYTLAGAVYRTTNSNAVVCNWAAGGYRLPTEAEWEKAARGGLSGKRFPWGNTISHSQANYYSDNWLFKYDVSPTREYHPTYATGDYPFTSPVGSFAANGYGLYDMAGNVWEWCWDWFSFSYYSSSPGSDPRGAASGSTRVVRGSSWGGFANGCGVAYRFDDYFFSDRSDYLVGFRPARSSVP